jgi:vacuolar-type H+-ATPase subunit E/Vma4
LIIFRIFFYTTFGIINFSNLISRTRNKIRKIISNEQYTILLTLVKELTQEILEETLQAYAEYKTRYCLKFYHFEEDIDETVFNQLQAEHKEYLNKLYELDEFIIHLIHRIHLIHLIHLIHRILF